MEKNLLAVDIGGTSSRFAHFVLRDASMFLQNSIWLKTQDASSFDELLKAFEQTDFSPKLKAADYVVFAVAGPIEDGIYCSPPNIDWRIDLRKSQSAFGIQRVSLINDFLAQACACVTSVGEEARMVIPGEKVHGGTKAVVGAGTGLGKALLVENGKGSYLGVSSEGGHGNFAAESEREFEMTRFIASQLSRSYITWEDVVSGSGLSRVHEFLTGARFAPAEVATTFQSENETLQWCARFYGRVCRNFALDTLATGGVYLAGGVAAKNPKLVEHSEFTRAFHESPVHGDLLKRIPVYLMDNQESGLWGGAYYGAQRMLQTS